MLNQVFGFRRIAGQRQGVAITRLELSDVVHVRTYGRQESAAFERLQHLGAHGFDVLVGSELGDLLA